MCDEATLYNIKVEEVMVLDHTRDGAAARGEHDDPFASNIWSSKALVRTSWSRKSPEIAVC